MMAGIMGGAVHITIIAMHTYNVNARNWGPEEIGLAWTDTFLSMFLAFGIYSVTIFVAAASVLHPQGIEVKTAFDLARPLKPVLGVYAHGIFLAGFWAAVFSTIMPTYLAAGYFIADKMKWDDQRPRYPVQGCCFFGMSDKPRGAVGKGQFLDIAGGHAGPGSLRYAFGGLYSAFLAQPEAMGQRASQRMAAQSHRRCGPVDHHLAGRALHFGQNRDLVRIAGYSMERSYP